MDVWYSKKATLGYLLILVFMCVPQALGPTVAWIYALRQFLTVRPQVRIYILFSIYYLRRYFLFPSYNSHNSDPRSRSSLSSPLHNPFRAFIHISCILHHHRQTFRPSSTRFALRHPLYELSAVYSGLFPGNKTNCVHCAIRTRGIRYASIIYRYSISHLTMFRQLLFQ